MAAKKDSEYSQVASADRVLRSLVGKLSVTVTKYLRESAYRGERFAGEGGRSSQSADCGKAWYGRKVRLRCENQRKRESLESPIKGTPR